MMVNDGIDLSKLFKGKQFCGRCGIRLDDKTMVEFKDGVFCADCAKSRKKQMVKE